MRKISLFGILSLFALLISCNKENNENPDDNSDDPNQPVVFAVDIGESVIPYVIINTDGLQIENEPKIPATMKIYRQQDLLHEANIGIEYRGSTSFRLSDKKSFGIETWDVDGNDTDASFFGFPEEEDWILQGHVVNKEENYIFDRTLMYNLLGYRLFEDMGRYASRTEFVEVELNGEYMGVYVFMEKLKRDNNRIDLTNLTPSDNDPATITGGYILKIDKTTGGDLGLNEPLEYFENNWEDDARYQERFSFRSRYDIFGNLLDFEPYRPPYHPDQYLETYFIYEDPKPVDITAEQKEYIQNYIDDFETALRNEDFNSSTRTYTNYIDLNSFVDYFLINELCRNVDAFRLSTFLTKDRGGKLKMGPIWDMNIGYDNGGRIPIDDWVINYNNHVQRDAWSMLFWWPRLMQDPIFREAVRNRWVELRSGVLSDSRLIAKVDAQANYLLDNGAVERNYNVWSIADAVNYQGSVENLKGYLLTRSSWMDDMISGF